MFNRVMRTLCMAAAVTLAQAGGVPAQQAEAEPGVVLELYTSQGCAACPPADRIFATLADRPGVIALGLHVDYWDYIGWRDRFAKPEFTARQKTYARRSGSVTIYTPQMIVGGTDTVQGFRPMAVQDLLVQHAAFAPSIRMALHRNGVSLRIEAEADLPIDREILVQIVRYEPSQTISISSGENAGSVVTYRNVVTHWSELARWDGAGRVDYSAVVEGDQPVVVILQDAGNGAILSAMRLR